MMFLKNLKFNLHQSFFINNFLRISLVEVVEIVLENIVNGDIVAVPMFRFYG